MTDQSEGRYVWIDHDDWLWSPGALQSEYEKAPASTLALLEDVLTRNGWERCGESAPDYWGHPNAPIMLPMLKAIWSQIEQEAAS